jgi:ankyrin repeat protein
VHTVISGAIIHSKNNKDNFMHIESIYLENQILIKIANGDPSVLGELNTDNVTTIERNFVYGVLSPLTVAAANGHIDIINHLLDYLSVVESIAGDNNDALARACENGHIDIVNRLLEYQAVVDDITAKDNYAFKMSAENGHVDVVNRLLESLEVTNNITAENNYALRHASRNGHLSVVIRLLENQEVIDNITAENNSAFMTAVGNGHVKIVSILLNHNHVADNIASVNNYALIKAAGKGHIEVVDLLLGYQKVVDNIAKSGTPALLTACVNGHVEVVKRLLEYPEVSANVGACDNYALKHAVKNDYYELSYILANAQWPYGIKCIPQNLRYCIPAIRNGELIVNTKNDLLKVPTQLLRWFQDGCIPTSIKDLFQPPGFSSKKTNITCKLPYNTVGLINEFVGIRFDIDTSRPTKEELTLISNRGISLMRSSSSLMTHLEKVRVERESNKDSSHEQALIPYSRLGLN